MMHNSKAVKWKNLGGLDIGGVVTLPLLSIAMHGFAVFRNPHPAMIGCMLRII